MEAIDRATNRIQSNTTVRLITVSICALILGGVGGLFILVSELRAQAANGLPAERDCTANAVMECGCLERGTCAEKMHENAQPGMAAAYAHFGVAASDYDRIAEEAVEGMAHPDGTVTVGDDVVMTNASSIGREQFSYSAPYSIDGHEFYLSSHEDVLQGNDLPVFVLMNGSGEAEFAMVKACGNPIKADKVEKAPPKEKEAPPKKQPPKEQPPKKEKKERPAKEAPREEAKKLPQVGAAGSVLGIFASTTGVGAAVHRLITRGRNR